jgi:hypothetical protein
MAVKTQNGTCALCLQPKNLRESHIASKFLWKQSGVIGDKKKFSVTSPTHPDLSESNLQDGLKEFLLCSKCEQQFSRYEDYAARKLFHDGGPVKNRPDRHFVWPGLDYHTLKLFQMSILWRMGVSSHPFYCNVELGRHEETLRRMLHAEDPGDPWQYGCMTTLLEHGGEPLLGIVSQPLKVRKFERHCYSYAIAGMNWVQFATNHAPEEEICHQVVLQTAGTWVLFLGEITEILELREQVELHRKKHKEVQSGRSRD